jgi:arsenite methyltransferase
VQRTAAEQKKGKIMPEQFYDEAMAKQQEALAATPDKKRDRDIVLGKLALRPCESVLEIGSGNGIFCREMLDAMGWDGHVCGLDNAEPMIRLAKALCPQADFHLGSATTLPFDDARFDAVTGAQVLCFIDDQTAAVREMFRVLKPGGRLVVLDTDWRSLVWNCADQKMMDRVMKLFTSVYADAHVPRTLSRRLEGAGFRIRDRLSHVILNWSLTSENYAGQTIGFVRPMMEKSADFSDDDWTEWIADQKATNESGEYLFSLNRYVFCAEKPEN